MFFLLLFLPPTSSLPCLLFMPLFLASPLHEVSTPPPRPMSASGHPASHLSLLELPTGSLLLLGLEH